MSTNYSQSWFRRNQRVSRRRIGGFRNEAQDIQTNHKCGKAFSRNTRDGSFRKYAKSVFGNSSRTILLQIAGSKTWKSRILKILVFLFCAFGFLYQTEIFLEYFWTYPSVTSVKESTPPEIIQPAMTFCSNNE
nr:uncharacterized protein LOC122271948 [Parasteatoda tepidariorum]